MIKLKDTKVYNIHDFITWYRQGELDLKPRYQRNPVWDNKAKSYLIDTILRGLPIPQIFIRQIIDVKTMKSVREVVDGQQRLRTIIGFIEGDFTIQKSHNQNYANMKFEDLSEEDKNSFLYYQIPTEVLSVTDENLIYDMFARLNTNSMTLNKQELRNAQYRGEFKVFAYNIASSWRDFFISINTFNEKSLSRMNDVDFINSLIILTLDGVITDLQKVFDSYYKKYNDDFEFSETVKLKLNEIYKVLYEIFDGNDYNMLQSKNYLYTLYAFILHHLYTVNNINSNPLEEYKSNNINVNIKSLINKLSIIDGYLYSVANKELELLPIKIKEDVIKLYQHHVTHTTSLMERVERIEILMKLVEDFI